VTLFITKRLALINQSIYQRLDIILDQIRNDDDLWLAEIKIKEPQCKAMTFFLPCLLFF
jgi:hypothetical protein